MPTRGIDFATLSLKDALDFAILVEEEASERYRELAQQMAQFRTHDAASLFEHMAHSEEVHRNELIARRRAEGLDEEPSRMARSMLFDVEAPEYDDARAFMSHRDAILVALKSETKVREFFLDLGQRVNDKAIGALFTELARDELGHAERLKAELARLPEEPLQGDVEDEPVAL